MVSTVDEKPEDVATDDDIETYCEEEDRLEDEDEEDDT